jgi:hypothetical protein
MMAARAGFAIRRPERPMASSKQPLIKEREGIKASSEMD